MEYTTCSVAPLLTQHFPFYRILNTSPPKAMNTRGWMIFALLLLGMPGPSVISGQYRIVPRDSRGLGTSALLGSGFSTQMDAYPGDIASDHDLLDRSLRIPLGDMITRKRSWWRYPLIGAAVGGLTFGYITYRECRNEDCIFPVGPIIVGVALGTAGGFVVEGITRVAGSRRGSRPEL